jgi:uncharacterized membrane protein (UPF0127 family)
VRGECSPLCALLWVRIVVANSQWARLRGLAWRREPPDGWALLIPRCRSVHTFGMRFPIDVVFLDADQVVVAIEPCLAPWKTAGKRGAKAVVELAAGECERRGLQVGDRLVAA